MEDTTEIVAEIYREAYYNTWQLRKGLGLRQCKITNYKEESISSLLVLVIYLLCDLKQFSRIANLQKLFLLK